MAACIFYYEKWIEDEIFDKVSDKLRCKEWVKQDQNEKVTFGTADSQTVKWINNRSLKSYDDNKKLKDRRLCRNYELY